MTRHFTFSDIRVPSEAQEPILAPSVRAALLEWLIEIWAEDDLAAVGLSARKRALFHGAPGTGKTTLAHHLAARLGLPLVVLRPEDIHGRYLGSNTEKIAAIFDAAESFGGPLVLFFDEFETAAQKRMTAGMNQAVEHDHNVMVNTLLVRLDRFAGFLIGATNFGGEIDPAVWRRFEIQIEIALPGQAERCRIIALYLSPFGLPRLALDRLAEAMDTASPSLIRQFCEGLKRQLVIGPGAGWDMARGAVIDRLVAASEPHPSLGRPRLWSLGSRDQSIRALPWPLPMPGELVDDDIANIVDVAAATNIVPLARS